MTGRSRIRLILVTLAVLAVGVWFVVAPDERHPAPASAAAPRPTDSTWPLLGGPPSVIPPATPSVPPATAGTAAPSATGPSATGPSATGQADPGVPAPGRPGAGHRPAAEPFVQNFANQPGARPQRALPSPRSTHHVRANVDGCDHNYGAVTQCVPWTFPAGTTDKCGWLAAHGFANLAVKAVDRQKLDSDRNGIACDE